MSSHDIYDLMGKLPKLKNLEGIDQVVTRFAPEPSGHLHIGHTRAIFLNQCYSISGKLLFIGTSLTKSLFTPPI